MAETDLTTGLEVLGEEELVDDAATEFDLLFPVVPLEDDPYPPDEGGDESLISDLEDQQDPAEAAVDPETPGAARIREEVAFDWASLEFFKAPSGDPLRVQGAAAIVEWAMKAINTPKGEYPIYSESYGSTLQALLGQELASPVLFAESARTITECLLEHPRITKVDIEAIRHLPSPPDALFIDLSMFIDDHDEPVEMEMVV